MTIEADLRLTDKIRSLELMGKKHKLFTEKLEVEDKTKSVSQSLIELVRQTTGQEISEEQAEKIMNASIRRANLRAVPDVQNRQIS